jgi:hypothetical protein
MGIGDVAACILNFASVKVSVQFHALDAVTPGIGVGGPQSQSAFPEEEKDSLPLFRIGLSHPTIYLGTVLMTYSSFLNAKKFQKIQ